MGWKRGLLLGKIDTKRTSARQPGVAFMWGGCLVHRPNKWRPWCGDVRDLPIPRVGVDLRHKTPGFALKVRVD